MGDAHAPANLHIVSNRQTHDAAISAAQGTLPNFDDSVPTLLYVSSASNPSCRTALPKVIALAENHPHVAVHVMELTPDTTPMIKFGPQNTPIFIMMQGNWCETVLGPDFERVELAFKTKFKKEE